MYFAKQNAYIAKLTLVHYLLNREFLTNKTPKKIFFTELLY